jgi:hypothetical protein
LLVKLPLLSLAAAKRRVRAHKVNQRKGNQLAPATWHWYHESAIGDGVRHNRPARPDNSYLKGRSR